VLTSALESTSSPSNRAGDAVRRNVLVFHIGFIGDTVVSIPALRAIRRHFGEGAKVSLLHEENARVPVTPFDVLAGLGLVDRFLTYRYRPGLGGPLLSIPLLWLRLMRARFDEVIYLAPSERPPAAVRRDELFFRLCGIPVRRGFATPDELPRSASARSETRTAEVRSEMHRKLDRLALNGIDVTLEREVRLPAIRLPEVAIESTRRWLAANRRHPKRGLIAICPGAKNPANWWPTERFVEIGRRLLKLGRYELIVVGGPSDQAVAQHLLAQWGDGINAAGALPVLGSAAALAECEFMIGLNTGMTHLAGALGIGGVALYGSRDPEGLWDPFGGVHAVVRNVVPCAGCRHTTCPIEHHPCMTGISVETVWARLQPLLDAASHRSATSALDQRDA
jgi:ADP-heptose:LPS heptosyltransferase